MDECLAEFVVGVLLGCQISAAFVVELHAQCSDVPDGQSHAVSNGVSCSVRFALSFLGSVIYHADL